MSPESASDFTRRRYDSLLALAHARFAAALSPQEEKILLDTAVSEEDAHQVPEFRPEGGWALPMVRRSFLRWLLTDEAVAPHVYGFIAIEGVRLPDELILTSVKLHSAVAFRSCLFEQDVRLTASYTRYLWFENCTLLSSFNAVLCRIEGSLSLSNVAIHGQVWLNGAQVTGIMECQQLALLNLTVSLDMTNASVGGDVTFTDNCEILGTLDLQGVRVDGYLSFSGARLRGVAAKLILDGAKITSNLILRTPFECAGQVRIQGAKIGHWLLLDSAKLTNARHSLVIDMIEVGGHVFARGSFLASGQVLFQNSIVHGKVSFAGAELRGKDTSLDLDGTHVHGSLELGDGLQCTGKLSMVAIVVEQNISFDNATFYATDTAIFMPLARVGKYVFMRRGFACAGTVNMLDCELGGLEIADARLSHPTHAVILNRAIVRGPVALDEGSECAGEISLFSATVKGQIRQIKSFVASLNLQAVEAPDLLRRDILRPEDSKLCLVSAKLGKLRDAPNSWPAQGNLSVNGMTAGEILPLTLERIKWLNRQEEKARLDPQPWIHLSKHLRDKGSYAEGKRVLFELRRQQARFRRAQSRFGQLSFWFHLAVAEVEEQPHRILFSLLVCVLLGTAVIRPNRAHFSETGDAAYRLSHAPHASKEVDTGAYPRFVPVIYVLDNSLPIIHLGQDDKWAPDPRSTSPALYWTLVVTRWLLIAAGWAQGIVIAAALDARFRSQ